MKTKVFISQVSPKKDTKKRTDYWGLLFVGFIFTASISSFLFSAHQEQQNLRSSGVSYYDDAASFSIPKLDLDHSQKA